MKIIAYESNDAIPSAVADKATVYGSVEGIISCCYRRRRDEATSSVTRMIISYASNKCGFESDTAYTALAE